MKSNKAISLGMIFVLWLFSAAQHCDAALFIDDTYTTQKGHFELEFSVDYYRDVEKEFDTRIGEHVKEVSKEWDSTVYLSYGLNNNWDVGVAAPYQFLEDSGSRVDGFSDIIIETKYRFWEEGRIEPSYAIYLDLKTDSADHDKWLGTGRKEYTLNNIFTKYIGNNVFDLNLGYIFIEGRSDDVFFYAFDIARDLTEKINLCAEIYGETLFKGSFDENIFITALSLNYQLNHVLCFESGFAVGISEESPDYQISSSIIFSF